MEKVGFDELGYLKMFGNNLYAGQESPGRQAAVLLPARNEVCYQSLIEVDPTIGDRVSFAIELFCFPVTPGVFVFNAIRSEREVHSEFIGARLRPLLHLVLIVSFPPVIKAAGDEYWPIIVVFGR